MLTRYLESSLPLSWQASLIEVVFLRILHISSAQSFGGGERHLTDLVKALIGRGHDLYVALRPNSPITEELKELPTDKVVTFSLRNALDAKSARELRLLVRE